jgi:hypothetical protein
MLVCCVKNTRCHNRGDQNVTTGTKQTKEPRREAGENKGKEGKGD